MANRLQRKRIKDWKMPPNSIYVGRPTKWGNPFVAEEADDGRFIVRSADSVVVIDRYKTLAEAKAGAVRLFRKYLKNNGSQPGAVRDSGGLFLVQLAKEELLGKDLLCWCGPSETCHADVWLEIANS